MAGNAARHLGRAYDGLSKSVERLSSGLRINSAKDDAAGLAVRELIRADIAVLQQGSRNASDGISMLQTMEGAMGVIDDNLIRMKELAEQAETGSYSSAQRAIMDSEFSEMAAEIDRIAKSTSFNGNSLLNTGAANVEIHVGTTDVIDITAKDMTKVGLSLDTGEGSKEYVSSKVGVLDADATLFTTAATAEIFGIEFTGETAILANTFAISQAYTMNEAVDEINKTSRAASEYNAAEVVLDDATGQYKIKISAKASGDINPVAWTGNTFSSGDGLEGTDFLNIDGAAGGTVNIKTSTAAKAALTTITDAINTKDEARAEFGYKMNRLESTISILDIQSENLMTAESRISDVDVATEMATLTRTQVLAQAGISMLAQANTMPQMALTLLR